MALWYKSQVPSLWPCQLQPQNLDLGFALLSDVSFLGRLLKIPGVSSLPRVSTVASASFPYIDITSQGLPAEILTLLYLALLWNLRGCLRDSGTYILHLCKACNIQGCQDLLLVQAVYDSAWIIAMAAMQGLGRGTQQKILRGLP